jgi:hypothetical protein
MKHCHGAKPSQNLKKNAEELQNNDKIIRKRESKHTSLL